MLKALRKHLKFRLYNSVPGFAGHIRYFGTDVHFPPGAPALWALCEQGIFEPEIVARLRQLVRPGTTMMDVGANIGLMAIPVLQACDSCRVISFEPSPNSLPFLERTARDSDYCDRWLVVGKAVSDAEGARDFAVGAARDNFYEGFGSQDRIPDARTVTVPVTTLDAEWARQQRPEVSVIKIDVEGAEGLVLAGASRLLTACRPAIVVEWHEPYLRRCGTAPASLVDFAHAHGYRIFTIPAGVPVDDAQALRVQMFDCQNFLLDAAPHP